MDFTSLLHVASKNQSHRKEPVKCLQTKFKPPTKEQREKDKTLSDGVKKFLERKEKEEKEKERLARRKREELLALRALDPKAKKRVQTMLKRTKSANKSVMEDAVDSNNTADTLAGPLQPDEDDYGFVSEASSALYNKLIEKMYNEPSDDSPKFSPSKKPSSGNLMSTKERVKMALLKQEEEEKGPHKRKRRKREDGKEEDDEDENVKLPPVEEKDKKSSRDSVKIKRPPPPAMDFMELLKLAEKKQHEPIVIEPKVKKMEPDQLMTKRQREEHEKMLEEKRQREIRLKALERGEVPPSSSNSSKPEIKRIPKIGQTTSEQKKDDKKVNIPVKSKNSNNSSQGSSSTINGVSKPEFSKTKKAIETPSISKTKPNVGSGDRVSKKTEESETERLRRERDEALKILKEREEAVRMLEEKERLIKERDEARAKLKLLEQREAQSKSKQISATSQPPNKKIEKKEIKPTTSDVNKPKPVVNSGVREFPPKDLKKINPPQKGVREFPPRDVRGIAPRPGGRPLSKEELRRKRLAEIKRRRIEDSDEYDSDLDDFIDDGPDPTMEGENVSEVISKIFKYDKNKYSRYDDAADECMESNWAQISKEEYYSTKCGILEDLEDMKAEKEALKKKKGRVKK